MIALLVRDFADARRRAIADIGDDLKDQAANHQFTVKISNTIRGGTPLKGAGLSSNGAERRLAQFGRKEIVEREKPSRSRSPFELWQPIPWMLEAAIVLQIAIGERLDAAVIAALLLFNVALSYFQEGKAQAALSILK